MISSFDIQNLDKLLKDFYIAVGIRISIFDDEFKLVTEYPKEPPTFCAMIRSKEEGLSGCHKCDREACLRAKKMRKTHIYTCHAGLTEAITPIQIGGGVLGYAILAHMLPTENYQEAAKKACDLAEAYGISRAKSLRAISAISSRTKEEINAAVSILDAVASFVYIRNLAVWKNEDISAEVEKYIKTNLKEKITSQGLCKQFNISRTNLYKLSQNAFGMGIMQYVLYCRVERAKELLTEDGSILGVAESVGFTEYNYFCKVFKREVGMTASGYSKKHKKSK